MRIHQTFDPEFDKLYNNYCRKYPELMKCEGIDRSQLDIGVMSKRYFTEDLTDVTIDTNANADEDRCPNNYSAEITKGIMKLEGYYLLWHYAQKRFDLERANELIEAIWKGDVYFHDMTGTSLQTPYCYAFSTNMIMHEGRPYGQLHSLPPKRADSFLAQCTETTMDLSQEFAGAIAPSDLIVNYAWYAQKENLSEFTIQNDFQKFVHVINNKFRVGNQSPFINISLFDRQNLEKVFEHYTYPDGSKIDIEYVIKIEKLFGEWFSKGDPDTGLPYRFPIVSLNISKNKHGEIVDQDFLDWTSKVNINTGCFNIYVNSGSKVASCCRLINNRERMQYRVDTFGNGGLSIGSHRVVTINLPRIAQKSSDIVEFMNNMTNTCNIVRDLLLVHRYEILRRRVNQKFLKFFNPLKWFSLDHLFSTIGIIGVYEMNKFMGIDITSRNGIEFTTDVLNKIEELAVSYSRENKCSFNVEEIPGESVAIKFCQKDNIMFGENEFGFKLYSNQYIPLIEDALIPERIQLTGQFQDILSGGGILHINMQDQIKDPADMKHLIEYSVKNGVSHFAVNYGFGKCENGHTTVCGNSNICAICGAPITDHYTRIVGYFTHVDSWNSTRREFEFPRRVFGELQ